MKIKCGTDIIEIERIKKAINENENFTLKIYTEKEIEYCESKKKAKYQHYAARFAAKEAVFKAISEELNNNKYDIEWKDIEIQNKANGMPVVFLKRKIEKIQDIEISLSHCKEYAVANVIVQIK